MRPERPRRDGKLHRDRGGMPSRGRKSVEDGILGSLFVRMKRLRVEFPGKAHDVLLGHRRLVAPKTHADLQIVEPLNHRIFASLIATDLKPNPHRQLKLIARWRSLGQTAHRIAGRDRNRAGIEDIVTSGAGADPRIFKPTINLAKSLTPEQPATKCIARFGLLRRQRPVFVQPQKYQLGMNLAYVDERMRAQKGVDLHDLSPDVPELARDTLLAAAQRLSVCLVWIGKLLPEPTPRACENARDMRS